MGTLVSFEFARRLRRAGQKLPKIMFMSGRRAPHFSTLDAPMHDLPEPDFRERLRQLSGTPLAVLENDELFALLFPTLRADFELVETYRYMDEPPLTTPIVALGGMDDPMVSQEQLEAWHVHTTENFQIRMFPGNHFYLQSEEPALLKQLNDGLLSLAKCKHQMQR
jgi:medium-chain acyl-[acyl-carrier-protein] hydrolase